VRRHNFKASFNPTDHVSPVIDLHGYLGYAKALLSLQTRDPDKEGSRRTTKTINFTRRQECTLDESAYLHSSLKR